MNKKYIMILLNLIFISSSSSMFLNNKATEVIFDTKIEQKEKLKKGLPENNSLGSSILSKNKKAIILMAIILGISSISYHIHTKNAHSKKKKEALVLKKVRYKRLTNNQLIDEINYLSRSRNPKDKIDNFLTVNDLKKSIASILKKRNYTFDKTDKKWKQNK